MSARQISTHQQSNAQKIECVNIFEQNNVEQNNNHSTEAFAQSAHAKNYLFGRTVCPYARRLMMGLAEKHIPYTFEMEMSKSTDDSLPIFLDKNETPVSSVWAIIEYLEYQYKQVNLMGNNIFDQNEVRRLISWCDTTLATNLTTPFIFEKIYKRIWHLGSPKHEILKDLRKNMHNYLEIVNQILADREYFACNILTWADITLASHISCMDYLNEINWMNYDHLYAWYLKIKSRPSFVTILHEQVPSIPPAIHYSSIDFDQDSQKTVRFYL